MHYFTLMTNFMNYLPCFLMLYQNDIMKLSKMKKEGGDSL